MSSEDSGSKGKRVVGIIAAALTIEIVLTNMNLIYGLLSTVFPIGSTGVIASAGIRVYRELECINNVSLINWQTLSPGQSKDVTVYVKNTGTVPLSLDFNATNWSPPGSSTYFDLSWDYTGAQIQPNQVLAVKFTLSVSQYIQGITSFSFDIYITGTEAT